MESSQGGQTVENETGSRELSEYLPLYNAALKGDWETANTLFFEKNREETKAIITPWEGGTALHVAVQSGEANDFVKKLVALMSPQALALKDFGGNTALHNAAMVGNTEAAVAMVEKYPDLLYIKNGYNDLAVISAAVYCKKETLEYLISVCKPNVENTPFEGQLGLTLLLEIIGSEFFDVALDLVEKYPDLARLRVGNSDKSALTFIAAMPTVFPSRESFNWWEKFIYRRVPLKQHESRSTSIASDIEAPNNSSISSQIINGAGKQCNSLIWKVMEHLVPGVKDMREKKEMHKQALNLVNCLCQEMKFLPAKEACLMLSSSNFRASMNGISEIVLLIMDMYPIVTYSVDSTGRNIMHMATINRFENVFNLTYSMSDRKHLFSAGVDSGQNTLMHMCARLAPPDRLNLVPGAALQMQRELQWFNELQRLVPPSRRKWTNNDGKTAKLLFSEEHNELKEKGEKWMKDTANACSIASALIGTVVFAAAFTVPGGLSSDTGIPIFSKKPAFVLFATTNAVSMFTSITSLMMFLSILTSRYTEEDFLHVLPRRLCYGLLNLFISILFMLIAFSAALYLGFRTKVVWFIISVATFGWWPVASFVRLQFPLLIDVIYSTYGPGIFDKKIDRFIY